MSNIFSRLSKLLSMRSSSCSRVGVVAVVVVAVVVVDLDRLVSIKQVAKTKREFFFKVANIKNNKKKDFFGKKGKA